MTLTPAFFSFHEVSSHEDHVGRIVVAKISTNGFVREDRICIIAKIEKTYEPIIGKYRLHFHLLCDDKIYWIPDRERIKFIHGE